MSWPGRTYSLRVEIGIVALTFLAWQIVRIPFEGSRSESLTHAGDWLAAERSLHLDIEPALIRFVHEHAVLRELAGVAYSNLHVPVVVGLLVLARLRSPGRYPKLRTAFVLAHLPALAVIAAYPLAPPHWLSGMPFAGGPPADLADLRNATAAAASLHFGYAVLVAGAALWLWPRSPLAWSALLYPPLVFAVILGTGNHYVLDTAIGAACIALAAAGAHLVHGHVPRHEAPVTPARPGRTALAALAAALAGFLANGLAT
jgi:PAP2 superfamily